MKFAFITLNRIVEEKVASDSKYRKVIEQSRRPLLSHGRAMSDEALLEKLKAIGLAFDKPGFLAFSQEFDSAEEMADSVYRAHKEIPVSEHDWIWIAFTCLWERWQPERPSLEMVDDLMQDGYQARKRGDAVTASQLWLTAWHNIWGLIETNQIESVEEFDDRYSFTQCLFNWIQDFVPELSTAGHIDPSFHHKRMAILQLSLAKLELDHLTRSNFQSHLAETHFKLGEPEKGEELFRRRLLEEPTWGFGWIHWSDCYFVFCDDRVKDPAKAEELLKRGLSVPGVENRLHLLERLRTIYSKTDRCGEAKDLEEEIEKLRKAKYSVPDSTEPEAPVKKLSPRSLMTAGRAVSRPTGSKSTFNASAPRVGRNERCPCGSGKKYKKCCGGSAL